MRKETKQEKEEEKKIEVAEEFIPKEAEVVVEGVEVPKVPTVIIPEGWQAKTQLGKDVSIGKITSIDEIFANGLKINEPQIIDILLPNLENEIILIGGSTGKGGGIRRTPSKRTTRMHKSGRRYRVSVMVAVGNRNGYIGIGLASGLPGKHRDVVQKAINKAKLNLIPIRRGCGSWECACSTAHSIPYTVNGKAGSVRVKIIPAPKGIGLVVNNEVKKLMRLAGIRDIWFKSRGQTQTRINLLNATFDALMNLNKFKSREDFEKATGMKQGKVM